MVNKENIRIVKEAIAHQSLTETDGVAYDQGAWKGRSQRTINGHSCGTRACIAGWTVALLDPNLWNRIPNDRGIGNNERGIGSGYGIRERAMKLLGLDERQATILFQGRGNRDWDVCAAAYTLDHLEKTGEVSWDHGQAMADADKAKEKSDGE